MWSLKPPRVMSYAVRQLTCQLVVGVRLAENWSIWLGWAAKAPAPTAPGVWRGRLSAYDRFVFHSPTCERCPPCCCVCGPRAIELEPGTMLVSSFGRRSCGTPVAGGWLPAGAAWAVSPPSSLPSQRTAPDVEPSEKPRLRSARCGAKRRLPAE